MTFRKDKQVLKRADRSYDSLWQSLLSVVSILVSSSVMRLNILPGSFTNQGGNLWQRSSLDALSLSRKVEFKESLSLYLLFFSAHSSPNTPKLYIWEYHALNSHSRVLGWHLLQPSELRASVAPFSSQVLKSIRALGVMGAMSSQSSWKLKIYLNKKKDMGLSPVYLAISL